MLNNPLKCAIYVRVSSEMQIDNYSLDAQIAACQSFAQLRDWQVASIYREEGVSAKTMERPVFQQMLAAAESGQFKVVLVHKLDRFSRKLKDMIHIIDYFDEIDIALVSATEQFDLSTPQGKMMVNVMSSVNQWYLDNLSQEISKGKRQRAQSGGWNGRLSYGYTTPARLRERLLSLSDTDSEYKIIHGILEAHSDADDTAAVVDPVAKDAVLLAFEQYATGLHSFKRIADILNEAGYRCDSRDGTGLFSKTMISELLRNRFYIGETSYGVKVKGRSRKWVAGNHDAIITDELFEQCQRVRAAFGTKHKASNRARPYPLTPMTYELMNGVRWRGRFRAGKREYVRKKFGDMPGTHVKADKLESEVVACLSDITIPSDWRQQIMDQIAQTKADTNPNYHQLQGRLDRLKKLFLLGDISEEEYVTERGTIQQALGVSKTIKIDTESLDQVAEIIQNLDAIWGAATLEERDKLAKMLFHKVYINQKSVIAIEPSATLWHLMQSQSLTACGEDRYPTLIEVGEKFRLNRHGVG